MSLIGGYRASSLIAKGTEAGKSGSASIYNFVGFKPSGLTWGNAVAVCLYCWSGANYSTGDWIPVTVQMLK